MKKYRFILLLGIIVFAGSTGCFKGKPTTCKGWAKYLNSPVRVREAIRQLGKLKCKDNLKDLEKIYPTSEYKELILQTVRDINAPQKSVGILKLALSDPSTALIASAIVEEMRIPGLRSELIKILTENKFMKARLAALKALIAVDKDNLKKDKDILIKLVNEDIRAQDIRVNSLAAETLGKLHCKDAVGPLILLIFKRASNGAQVYLPVREALNKIGAPAVEPIIAVLNADTKGKYGKLVQQVAQTAEEYGLYKWQWKDSPELIQILGDLRDKRALPTLVQKLTEPLQVPAAADDRAVNNWRTTESNKITMSMTALWSIGDESIIEPLQKAILNTDNDAVQRLKAAIVMALIPSPKADESLITIYKKSKDGRFRAPLLKPLMLGITWQYYQKFKPILDKDKDPAVLERVRGKTIESKEFNAYRTTLETCKADVNCYIKKLEDQNMSVVQKALVMLIKSKLPDKSKVINKILKVYINFPANTPAGVDARKFALVALWRLGDHSIIPKIREIKEQEEDLQKVSHLWLDELESLALALERK